MCMFDDSDGWKFVHESRPKARKEHRCGECGRSILPGEQYLRINGITYDWDQWEDHKMCAHCETAARWLIIACSGYLLGGVEEDLAQHVTGDESYLRSRPLTRLVRWMAANWNDRSGSLRPVDAVRSVTDEAIAVYRAQYAKAVA